MRLLIVGQAPSRTMARGARPFEGARSLTLLAKYAGLSPRERLYDLADVINVIRDYPGPAEDEKYDAFPIEDARAGIARVHRHIVKTRPEVVVSLGRKVTNLFGVSNPEWFVEYVQTVHTLEGSAGFTFIPSPHPAGTSMWWNDPANLARGIAFWTNLMAEQRELDAAVR